MLVAWYQPLTRLLGMLIVRICSSSYWPAMSKVRVVAGWRTKALCWTVNLLVCRYLHLASILSAKTIQEECNYTSLDHGPSLIEFRD